MAVIGCQSGSGPAPGASASAAASSSAPLEPVDACIETIRTEATSTDSEAEGRMARGCAAIYKEEVCRTAHLSYDAPEPASRPGTLSQRCAAAYCEKLPAPKPKLCGGDEVPAQQLGYLWLELRTAIWKHDLGEAAASRLEKEHLRLGALRRRK